MPRKTASPLLNLDFTRNGFCESQFVTSLGRDGQYTADGDGLTINSRVFSETKPVGEMGFTDQYKFATYFHVPIQVAKCREQIFEATLSSKQFFNSKVPFPPAFAKRILDMHADPRLAHGQFSLIDPKSGIVAGFFLTDHAVHGFYGRLPDTSCFKDYTDQYATDCVPCKSQCCDTVYNCSNFFEDCRYQEFKQNTTQEQFTVFMDYLQWVNFAAYNNVNIFNWKVFAEWRLKHPANCTGCDRPVYVSWKSTPIWEEYCAFQNWDKWQREYIDWLACSNTSRVATCCAGECSNLMIGTAAKSTSGCCPGDTCTCCYHVYEDTGNCYDKNNKTKQGLPEEYAYQFGRCRNCCCYCPASFLDTFELVRRENCNDLCSFVRVAIGIDRQGGAFNFYVNNKNLFTVPSVGHRLAEEHRVIEHNGYAEDIDISQVLICMGTGTLLDAAVSSNYWRWRSKNDYIQMTALVPTMDTKRYFQVYFNTLGELTPVNPQETFAIPQESYNDCKYRNFGQGAILKVRSIRVYHVRCKPCYPYYVDPCPKTCCAPNQYRCGNYVNCPSCCECDSDDECCELDPRDYNIEFSQPAKPTLIPNCNNTDQTGFGVLAQPPSSCITAKLTRNSTWDRRHLSSKHHTNTNDLYTNCA